MSIKIASVLALCTSMAIAAPAIWNGTADVSWYTSSAQAYNLTTAEQLAGLAKLVNQGTSSFEGKTITLGADIFLNDTAGAAAGTWASVPHTEWTPIGTSSRPFKGEFDGIAGKKNRKIYGLYVNNATKDYVGLFGYTNNVKIGNLDVLVGRITAKDNVGALVGYAAGGSVTNVHSEVKVTGNNHVGGLVGYFTGTLSTSSVKENVVGQDSVGGLVGVTTGSVSGTAKSNSYFTGNVTGRKYVGGLIGAGLSVSKSYAEGTIKGDSCYVGGIAGYVTGNIDSTYHIGGDVSGAGYVGGLVGLASSSVSNSYSEGNVTGTGNYVGGLIGLSYYYYSGTSNETVMTARNSYAIGNVTGKGFVGGLVGLDSIYNTDNNTKTLVKNISYSHSVGNVVGKDNYVGGVLGKSSIYNYRSKISQQILSSYHKGSVESDSSYVGGVVGYAFGNISWSYHIDGDVSGAGFVGGVAGIARYSVSNSYSEGNVTGTSSCVGGVAGYGKSIISSNPISVVSSKHTKGDVSGWGYVGGLIGYTEGPVTSSLSEGDVTGQGNYVGGLIGLSYYYTGSSDTTIMTAQNSYAVGNVKGKGYVGGLIGLDSSYSRKSVKKISNSHSVGNVIGKDKYVGGVLGKSNGGGNLQIHSSYHKGSVESTSDYVGGVAGYASGIIDSTYHIDGHVSGNGYVGGLVGYVSSTVSNSYSEGNVTGASSYVGGLIGLSYYYYSSDSSAITIMTAQNSYATGNVSGKGYVGGLIGLDSIYISYRPSSDTKTLVKKISNSHSVGNVVGKDKYVGGVLGKSNYGYYSSSYSSNISLQMLSSYHKGSIESDSSYVGGVAGYVSGDVDSTYHVDGNVNGSEYVGGLIGLASSSVKNSYSEGDVTGTGKYVGGLIGHGVSVNSSNHAKGSVSGFNFIGGLIGYASSSVKNSYSEGDVTGTGNYIGGLVGKGALITASSAKGDANGQNYVGGLAGYTAGAVTGSHSEGDVTGQDSVGGLVGFGTTIGNSYHDSGIVSGKKYVGGLAGYTTGTVTGSHSEGIVSGTGNYVGGLVGRGAAIDVSYHEGGDVSGVYYVGGLAGYTSSAVTGSHSEGNVTGTRDYVGGTVGSASGKIRNSYAVVKYVRGRNIVGGLAGYAEDSIDVSYFEGDSVTGISQIGGLAGYAEKTVDSSYSTANIKGDDNVGGLIGSAYGDVSNSYAIGNVVGDVEHSSAGNDNLGGLVGYQYGGSVSKSMALGNVSGTTKLGGLVGRFDGTKISQSYANGNVTGDYYGDPADEVGNYYIGGLVGYAKGALEETYASGVVKGIEDEPVYTGCVVGYVNGSLNITKSYYDKTKCSLGVDGGEETATVTGSPDKTTTEMQTQSTFVNWDFVDTWKIYENTYPFLKIFTNSLTNAVVTTASLENIVYDGSAKTPIVTSVELFGETLTYGSDYTVAYKNNVDAGTATINVCGVNPYGGCKAINFVINAAAIVPTIASIEDVTYSGVALTPEISVYNGGTLLTDADYTVEYADNLNAGTASVTVTLKGNYSGSATKTFTIKKATPVISQNPTASNVVNGQTLASSELTGGSADVEGAFVWQAPETVPTLENDGYVAVFVPTDTLNYDSVGTTVPVEVLDYVYVAVHVGDETLDSAVVIKGGNYTLPNVPDSVGHNFVGLYKGNAIVGNPGDVIVLNENTVIEAIYEAKTFAITFVNGDVVLQSENTAYGTLPEYRGDTPAKTATVQYTYTFKGWNPAIASVTGAATYTAVFDSTVNKYMVTFKDGETVLQSGEVAYGTVPTAPAVTLPENTAQYSYSFDGWDSEVVAVTGPATYTAVINRTLNKYEVVFKDYDGSVLKSAVEYDYGTSADNVVKPSDPTRGSTAQYTYTFKGWNPSIADVTEAAIYTAEYDSTVRSYEIAFVNGISTLQSGSVEYGQTPVYSGAAPTKTATAQYTYTFKGWNPAIASVAGAATYKAVFDSTVNKYTITFKDGETVLQSGEVAYGTMPTAPAVTLPENTAQYSYSFDGWDSEIVAVTGPATYTAVINRALNRYGIVFKDYDGSVLKSAVEYDYGTSAASIAKPANPTRGSTAQYTYTFKGWNPSIADVMEAAIYTAEYDSTVRSYEIAFVNGSSTLQSGTVEYGQTPIYSGEAPTKTATAQYTYTFKGWSPAIASVAGATTYTAVFDSTVNKYIVTFMEGTTVLQSGEVAYGTVPTAPAVTLPENTAQYSYSFDGWDSEVVAVTGPATYTAVINRILNKYEVVFKNYDGSVLKSAVEYDYGTSAASIAKPANPTRVSTAQYTYTFKGWNPSIVNVTEAAIYTAEYDSTVRSYEIAFVNGNSTLQSSSVEYGKTPVYSGVAPAKTATAQYTYTFKGWNPAIASVTGAAAYTAVFDSTVNKYTVTFKDGETVLQSVDVAYGIVPTAPAITLPENTAQYTYSFSWDKEIVSVTGPATYNVVVNRDISQYAVIFRDFDGILLGSALYDYGTSSANIVVPKNPARVKSAEYTYTFKGWTPEITDVTNEAVYIAEYDSTKTSTAIDSTDNGGDTPSIARNEILNNELRIASISRAIQIAGAKVGSAYAILDMQGRVLKKGRVESANFNIPMAMAGNFLVRVGSRTQRISIR